MLPEVGREDGVEVEVEVGLEDGEGVEEADSR